jgi:O-antigen/teichoic acid export membrane protein
LLTALGAATTIVAPMVLDPVGFGVFALLLSIFQYVSTFDLGLSRLSDKLLTQPGRNVPDVMNALLLARFVVGAIVAIIVLALYRLIDDLMVVTALAGAAAMLSNGPATVYRARSEIAAFTLSSLSTQFGMSLPRLAGLLIDGVRGCIIACALWYGMVGLILHVPFVRLLRPLGWSRLLDIFATATPLFVLSTTWLLYQLASRWFSWVISGSEEYGLFAFGANLVVIGLGVIGTVSQTYYPRHLVCGDKWALSRELLLLGATVTIGCLICLLFCRFILASVFPRFAGADTCTAAILFSGIPLSLCAWLIPLVIARAERPLRDAGALFGTSLATLFGLMKLLDSIAGVDGQAWACTPPATALLTALLYLVVRRQQLLTRSMAWCLLAGPVCVEICSAVCWYVVFH